MYKYKKLQTLINYSITKHKYLVPKRKIRRVTKGKERKKRGWSQNPAVHQSQGGGAKTRIKVNEGLYRKKFLEILLLL